ncbi:class I SAM-dependent methyltransferase [Mycobacterium syngnathidarum]|uniref:class I SAM-dependent methyltransferase n=1 Tax=Mycobacterium syngnathidarum TaxID=1908205 RepID=UPI0013F4C67B|nr:class I SAM-dependent methyltransferase [Mycobacterium syngnathidarum]
MAGRACEQYDLIAAEYARAFAGQFDDRPLDRAMLRSFAELVSHDGGKTVLDVGCGPGDAAAELAAGGLRAAGVDGSSAMVSLARKRCPELRFQTADMFDLPYPAGSFDAVCAWYSIIHTPAETLPELFAEFRRLLSAPGWLLLGFKPTARRRSTTTPSVGTCRWSSCATTWPRSAPPWRCRASRCMGPPSGHVSRSSMNPRLRRW